MFTVCFIPSPTVLLPHIFTKLGVPHPIAATICGVPKAVDQLGTVLGGKFPLPAATTPVAKSPFCSKFPGQPLICALEDGSKTRTAMRNRGNSNTTSRLQALMFLDIRFSL